MRTLLAITLLAIAFPAVALADDDDDDRKWRNKRSEHIEKWYEKAHEDWRKRQEKAREEERKRWEYSRQEQERWREHGRYRPPGPSYGYRPPYEHRYAYPPSPGHPGYGEPYDRYGQRYAYPPYPSYPRHRHDDDDDDDDIDAIYTPWGYYEDYPKVPYDARRPRPEGRGQIGPFRFEVWK